MPTYRNKTNEEIVIEYTNSSNFSQKAIIQAKQIYSTEYILNSPDLVMENEEPYYNPVNNALILEFNGIDSYREVSIEIRANKIEIMNNCSEIISIYINSINNTPPIPVGGNKSKVINVLGDRINKIIVKASTSSITKQVAVIQYKDNLSVSDT